MAVDAVRGSVSAVLTLSPGLRGYLGGGVTSNIPFTLLINSYPFVPLISLMNNLFMVQP